MQNNLEIQKKYPQLILDKTAYCQIVGEKKKKRNTQTHILQHILSKPHFCGNWETLH